MRCICMWELSSAIISSMGDRKKKKNNNIWQNRYKDIFIGRTTAQRYIRKYCVFYKKAVFHTCLQATHTHTHTHARTHARTHTHTN